MQQKNPLKALVAVIVIALVVYLGSALVNNLKNVSTDNVAGKMDTRIVQDVQITVTDNNSKAVTYASSYKMDKTLFTHLIDLQGRKIGFSFTYTNSDYGAFINSVNGYVTDTKKEFWEIMINGKSAEVGMSAYVVQSGDKIELKISKIIN